MIINMLSFYHFLVILPYYCIFAAAYNFYHCPIVKPVYIVSIRHVAVDAVHSNVHKILGLSIFE